MMLVGRSSQSSVIARPRNSVRGDLDSPEGFVASLLAMTPDPAPVRRAFLETATPRARRRGRAFAAAESAPCCRHRPTTRGADQAREILTRLGAGGWLGYAVPEA